MNVLRPQQEVGAEPPKSAAELVEAARRGQAWAQHELFSEHAAMVNRLAFHLLGNDQEVDDLVQDSFVAALTSLPRLTHPEAFTTWLRAIVVNTALRRFRRRALRTRLGLGRDAPPDIDSFISPTASPETVLQLRTVYAHIHELPAVLRVTLVLRRIDGFSLEEVAQMTGSSLATVKRRLVEVSRRLGEWQAP